MAISTKDIKPEVNPVIEPVKPEVTNEKTKPVISDNAPVKAVEIHKRWEIKLTESASYTHPKSKKKIVRGEVVITGNKELADDLKTNGCFSVKEI